MRLYNNQIMKEAPAVAHDVQNQKFYLVLDGHEAHIRYRLSGKTADFYSTFVPEALRGRGLAEALCQAAFEHAKANQWRVSPSCSYISGAYLKRHPEWLSLK